MDKQKKRINTNIKKYGKGSNYGSEESIKKNFISVLNNKGYNYNEIIKLPKEQLHKLYGEEVSKRINSINNKIIRICNKFKIKKEDLNCFNSKELQILFSACYVFALRNKGRKIINEYNMGNINDFSFEEQLKLSGYKKKKNAQNKSKEQKEKDKLKWKITHLKNFFGEKEYELLNKDEINNLYRIYLYNSGRLYKTTQNGKGGKWEKGWIELKRLKYKIFYRSSFEKYFLYLCDKNINIIDLEFNLQGINYILNNEDHWYFPDFIIYINNKKVMIEIKASYKLKDEKEQLKFKVGKEYCEKNNMQFLILTEKELYNKNEENLWKLF